jgi:hypothetical protein
MPSTTTRITVRRLFAAALCLAGPALGPAFGQESASPLTLEVRPSGVEGESDEQKLDRRLKRAEFLFRSICTHCGAASAAPASAPFRPYDSLGSKAPAAQQ